MKHAFLLTLISLLSLISTAQKDSLRDEILNYSDGRTEIIRKGRGLLAKKFLEGDYIKVAEIKEYLENTIQDSNYILFYPLENLYLQYWTQQYEELLKDITKPAPVLNYRRPIKIAPSNDLLLNELAKKSRDSIEILESALIASTLQPVDKDFLILHLKYLTTQGSEVPYGTDTLNSFADEFLKDYPHSEYDSFVRKNIRFKFAPSKWAYTFEFFSGYGIFTDDMRTKFTNPIPIGVAFDINYSRLILFLRIFIGLHKTAADLPFDNVVWEKGKQSRAYIPEVTMGYNVFENKFLKLVPFAGFSWLNIEPTEYDLNKRPELEKAGYTTSAYTFGLNTDFKMGKPQTSMNYYGSFIEENYWFLKLRYSYNVTRFEKKYGIPGNFHSITLGVGGFGRHIKRNY